MNVLDRVHESFIYHRRIRRLADFLSPLIPSGSSLLDVGCGDAKLGRTLLDKRPDVRIEGVDVLVREKTWMPVKAFDGSNLPYPDASFDGVMLIDVLHHTRDPLPILREALRVSRGWLLVKDHVLQGIGAAWRLRFMDYVGNARHAVALPYNYLTSGEWIDLQRRMNLRVASQMNDLGLYPWPIDSVFGAGLHFIARWERSA